MVNIQKFSFIQNITTEEVFHTLTDPNFQLIDVRPVAAYNGWRIKNERRGGHIKGARCLPYTWSEYIDWIEIVRSKGILPSQSLILYGYDKEKTEQIAYLFKKIGYNDIRVYHRFLDEWNPNGSLPMEQLKRYRHLVSAPWVHQLITSGDAPDYTNTKYIIGHAHFQNRAAYEEGHIPKAIDIDTNLLESSDTWNRRSPRELKHALEQLGITYDTTVILYGRFSYPDPNDPFPGSSAGHLGAMRCAFIMLYAGVTDVRVLNGGLQAWIDAGYETTTQDYKKHPVKEFGAPIPSSPELVVDMQEAKLILKDPDKNLVSVRSWREFIGDVSGYNYIDQKGRIPGAVFGNCGSDAYHMENYRNLDHTTREYHEIEEMWKVVGITADKHNAFYCGTGWRGSEAFFNAWLMGWPHVSVFDGGWFEWSKQGNPYETGVPTQNQQQIILEGKHA